MQRSISPEKINESNFSSVTKKTIDIDSVDFDHFDSNLAKSIFRKMNYKSTYDNLYGEKPKVEDNFIILKQKKFRDIPYSQYFT